MTERAGLECVPLLAPASDRGSLGLQCKTRPGPAGGWLAVLQCTALQCCSGPSAGDTTQHTGHGVGL